MAKGSRTSLAVRAVALVFALALAALAARLWLRERPRGGESAGEDAVSAAPPLHEEIPDEDREALRELLRDDGPVAP